ncbi:MULTISPECIES: 3-oxoacyl-ACP synthase III family protein [unclassified Aureispira]|uniref:3-oxoacyl-ACP synthase III family protein n=1 Tax=unclassified Aureispira TaxID=2649989 RepID=UPI00069611F8|nr:MULTISPECIES: 3-oxoacyl-[acyl-carrier-protein] synthase III C-terminal domain-containing protein [unclassified Aureispira]WMX15442.1 3-oxoacyl-[acyl-carrier-protein] synthase III C-terminal domain-containing protein [Aureispira sp. CCB-E]
MKRYSSRIIGSGSVLPKIKKANNAFWNNTFFNKDHERMTKTNEAITAKFEEVAGIVERRVAEKGVKASDLGTQAAKLAIESSGIDPETLEYIIVAHNFGDVNYGTIQSDLLPNLAAKVKQKLGIKNPNCVAYDILFGCPSWVQAFIQANYYIKSGDVKRVMVVGADTVSRMTDPHDIDGMLFADGGGAAILEAVEYEEDEEPTGILSHVTVSDCVGEADYLKMGDSLRPETEGQYIRMYGKGVFRYAVTKVPAAMNECLAKAGLKLEDVDKFVMHQANMKMNKIILKRLYELNGYSDYPEEMMPLVVHKLGNSSAATVPTVLDLIMKGVMDGQTINKGDIVVFASVGAGMHANCVVYKHS